MKNTNRTRSNLVANKVEVNLDMLVALMLNRVGGEIDCADIVTVNKCRSTGRLMQLMKELTKPTCLGDGIGHSTVLSLGTGAGHSNLTLGRPRNDVVTQEYSVARGGPMRIWTACPISIRIGDELNRLGALNAKSVVDGATYIPQNPFESGKMRLPRIMHMKTDLLDSIRNIRPSESKIL